MRYGLVAGRKVSRFVLGAGPMGDPLSEADSFALLDAFAAAGGNAIDTARIYADGKSEAVVGRWLNARSDRADFFLITKCAHPDETKKHRLSKKDLDADIYTSLETLGLSYIDLLFLHRDDESVPVSDVIDGLAPHVAEGRVKLIGASNWRASRIIEANRYAKSLGLPGFVASEIAFSLARTTPKGYNDPTLVCMNETEMAAYTKMPVPVFAYGPQAKGYFAKLANGTLSESLAKRYDTPENRAKAERLSLLAKEKGVSPTALSAAYIASHPVNAYAIIGCRNLPHLADSLTAADIFLTPEEVAYLEG